MSSVDMANTRSIIGLIILPAAIFCTFAEVPQTVLINANKTQVIQRGFFENNGSHIGFDCEESDLHIAVLIGNLNRVNKLIQEGADIYALDCQVRTPMHIAILIDNQEIVTLLLKNNFDPNRRFQNCSSVLFYAVANGTETSLAKLVHAGAIADLVNCVGSTVLFEAVLAKKMDAARILQRNGANVKKILPGNNTYLHRASKLVSFDAMLFFLNQGTPVDFVNSKDETALTIAVEMESPDIINLLASNNANITRLSAEGKTYLYLAVDKKRMISLSELLRQGTPPDLNNLYGDTALVLAMQRGYIAAAEVLLGFGADLTQQWTTGTLLHAAAMYGRTASIQWLVDRRLSVNATDISNYIPLHWAATESHLPAVKLLVELGSCINCWTSSGFTPLYLANFYGLDEIVEYLRSKGGSE